MSYSLLNLTDFVHDIPTKIQIGYFMISLTIFTIVLNMYLISINVYKEHKREKAKTKYIESLR